MLDEEVVQLSCLSVEPVLVFFYAKVFRWIRLSGPPCIISCLISALKHLVKVLFYMQKFHIFSHSTNSADTFSYSKLNYRCIFMLERFNDFLKHFWTNFCVSLVCVILCLYFFLICAFSLCAGHSSVLLIRSSFVSFQHKVINQTLNILTNFTEKL